MKRFFALILALAMALLTLGCGEKEAPKKEFDRAALEKDVLANVKFSVELEPLNPVVLPVFYDIPEGVDSSFYRGGSSPNVFATFNAEDEKGVEATVKMLEELDKVNKANVADYNPADIKMIENSIIKTYETYVIYCITDDYENAEKIINSYIPE